MTINIGKGISQQSPISDEAIYMIYASVLGHTGQKQPPHCVIRFASGYFHLGVYLDLIRFVVTAILHIEEIM